jgi:hypothetical protein
MSKGSSACEGQFEGLSQQIPAKYHKVMAISVLRLHNLR